MVTVFDWDKYREAVAAGVIPSDLEPTEFTGGQPPMLDWWDDIKILGGPKNKERVGYPTQKPLALYERIIEASSKENDFVLDPFCGCATTPIAAERLGRQWVGIDIWDGAIDTVRQRIQDNRQLLRSYDISVHYETDPPIRTDDQKVAAPSLNLRTKRPTDAWQRISHAGLKNILAVAQSHKDGIVCAGCGRVLEIEFMELDHMTPKSDRGVNDISNRILLCRPCNGTKRDGLTLRGLTRANVTSDWMRDADLATQARTVAANVAAWVEDFYAASDCQNLIAADTPAKRAAMVTRLQNVLRTL